MPKHKLRKPGDDVRISKGKCASGINFDIKEQCVDEEKLLNCDEDIQTKIDEETSKVDTRTSDEIIIDAFEEFNSKSSRVRSNALTNICTQLQQSHNPDFLTKHLDRILTIIENALQSNNAGEIDATANLISLVAIQLPDSNRSLKVFYEPLKSMLENDTLRLSARSAVCHAIGILIFLYETDSDQIFTVMKEFAEIFLPNLYYRDVNKRTQSANYKFQVAAYETWIFLMTLLPPSESYKASAFSLRSVECIFTLLQSLCHNMIVVCAKSVAVIMECGLDKDKKYLEPHLAKVNKKISSIVNYWNRTYDCESTSDVLKYLEKGINPSKEIRNGKSVLHLNNWALTVRYEMLCNVIGSANVAKHLWKNEKLLTKLKTTHPTKSYKYSPNVGDTDNPHQHYRLISYATPPKEYDVSKISKNLEFATHKSPTERSKALEEICKEFHLVPHNFLADQKNVFQDLILRAMKRGNETEQLTAVRLATLIVLQLGREERFCSEISNVFLHSLKNSSTTVSTKASMCTALAFFELVDNEHTNSALLQPLSNVLRQLFSGNHKLSEDPSDLLQMKALEAWGLLLTNISPKEVCSVVKSQTIKDLTEMLHTPNAELRIVSGQVISLIIEQGRIHDSSYLKSDISDICDVIQDIVNDRKELSRDKRKLQNTKLRDILKYLQDGCPLSFKLRFADEVHELKTWSAIFKYQKLSQFIGPNLGTHLQENELIREIVGIGRKPVRLQFDLPSGLQYKLSSAAKKKSKTKENRLNFRTPKYAYE